MTAYRSSEVPQSSSPPTLPMTLDERVSLLLCNQSIPINGVSSLAMKVEFMHSCPKCDSEQLFVAGWQCEAGLVGCCLGCGDERIAPFTRVNSEVA